jgi:eukaryotic-like serine/threonine-protein kinase
VSLPDRIGRYRILGFLASGGMAEILLAKLLGPGGFERAVVVKRVLPHLARQPKFREMFLDEARIVARIRHPNVVDVGELGQEGRELFLVMEYLAGESVAGLTKRLGNRRQRLDPSLAAHIVAEASAGLHAAHELRTEDGQPLEVVHRDVSPQNIFLTYDGGVKLLDFGIAKFGDRSVETHTGQVKGKFAYMSPEQCCAEVLDRRSDVFALGIMLWELCTGERLFQRPNELLVWKAIVEEPIPRPSERMPEGAPPLSAELERVIMRALERDKEARYQTAGQFRRELLVALRQLDPEHNASEQLAGVMRLVFSDRIQQKDEMLRRVRAGDTITSVPSAEVDPDTGEREVDVTPFAEETPPTRRALPLPTRSLDHDPHVRTVRTDPDIALIEPTGARRRRRLGIAVAIATILVSAGGITVGVALTRDEAVASNDGTTVPSTAGAASTPSSQSPPAEVDSTGTPVTPPDSAEAHAMRIRVTTSPEGATVLLGGVERGTTPTEIETPRPGPGTSLVLRLDGYRDYIEELPSEGDYVHVRATLERERPPSSPPTGRPSGRPRRDTSGSRTSHTEAPEPPARPDPPPARPESDFYRFQ